MKHIYDEFSYAKHLINVTALGLEEEALEASYWHKGLCKLINGDIYVDPKDFHLILEEDYEEYA